MQVQGIFLINNSKKTGGTHASCAPPRNIPVSIPPVEWDGSLFSKTPGKKTQQSESDDSMQILDEKQTKHKKSDKDAVWYFNW